MRLNGPEYVEYVVKESYRRDQRLKEWLYGDGGKPDGLAGRSGVEMNLRTAEKDGALLFVSGRRGQAALRVSSGGAKPRTATAATPRHLPLGMYPVP